MKRKFLKTARFFIAVLSTLIIMFPLYWLIISSLKTPAEMKYAVPTFWPETFAWENYVTAFQAAPFPRYFVNTMIMTVGLLVLQLNVAFMAAYAFAKGTFAGKDKWFMFVVAALIVPEQVIFVPVYVMMSHLNWLDTFLALIIPHGASAYSIFLLRQSFKSIGNDIMDAAKADGAGKWTIIYRILVPMSLPTVVTLIIFKFISGWNSYFWPLIMTNTNEMRVVTIGITMLRDSFAGADVLNWNIIMAASVMVISPIVVLFLIAQKHIISAMSNSTFK